MAAFWKKRPHFAKIAAFFIKIGRIFDKQSCNKWAINILYPLGIQNYTILYKIYIITYILEGQYAFQPEQIKLILLVIADQWAKYYFPAPCRMLISIMWIRISIYGIVIISGIRSNIIVCNFKWLNIFNQKKADINWNIHFILH